jgi:hypothetical protein
MGLGIQCPSAAFAQAGTDRFDRSLSSIRLLADEVHDHVAPTFLANPLRFAIDRNASLMVGNFVGTSSPSPIGG